MKIFQILLISLFIQSFASFAQNIEVNRIDPPNWWVGMKQDTVNLLLYGKNLSDINVKALNTKAKILKTVKLSNPDYASVSILISKKEKAGNFQFEIANASGKKTIEYPLLERKLNTAGKKGFSPEDVMYLIMPDRFANGDPSNDAVPAMKEKPNRAEPFGRHGGDLKGIENKLEYLKDLGITTIWPTPILTNDQESSSYHGYAITDLYQVDPRFGSNAEYISLVEKSHAKGLKFIQDMVLNHIGFNHLWNLNPPDKNWINYQGLPYQKCNFRASTVPDPYAAKADRDAMVDGWFDTKMPDLNQRHPLVARHLIQNTLWWIETADLDGIRMDTYIYPDKDFMSVWVDAVKNEYPKFQIVGEVWIEQPELASYWRQSKMNLKGNKPSLNSITDFPLCLKTFAAFNEDASWDNGLIKLYNVLAMDYLQENPEQNVIFLDNHDYTRAFTGLKTDPKRLRLALAFLMTTRGIPQLYYGTEIQMDGDAASHPNVRKDFPGGWPGDFRSAFTEEGRTNDEKATFNYLKKLLNWRKTAAPIHSGKLLHYVPVDNIYVYFRTLGSKCIMVILNGNDKVINLDLKRFQEGIGNSTSGLNAINGQKVNLSMNAPLALPAREALILELGN